MLVAGIDEAGRGCVIGPLVVAGLAVQEENLATFAAFGVKDSKLLTHKKREALVPEILRLAHKHVVVKVQPLEIDRAVESQRKHYKLNRLEAQTMAQIVTELEPDVAYVDAADVVAKRFGEHVLEASVFKTRIVSEHKADRSYPVVSAASIIAKVERDKAVAALRAEFGDFGTGYLTDPKTGRFLKQWLKENSDFPECVRKSWKPAKQAKAEQGTEQMRLF
ncbi:MAG: ribonuclease HII [Candidatus Bathyarchaeota archaeon]|nr:ribonuclease HII [Candidatus Bathyarchaeota archaeon]